MDPPLAESLFVHVPLTWVTSGDAMRRRQGLAVLTLSWEIFFEHAQQEILLQALPSDLALAATWPDEDFEAIVSFLADRVTLASETHLPDSLPTAFVERLRRYRDNYIWKLPEILALDTTETGTNRLIAWAQHPPPPPPSLVAYRYRWRELFLEKLDGRRLTPEQKRQVVALLSDPELRNAVFRWCVPGGIGVSRCLHRRPKCCPCWRSGPSGNIARKPCACWRRPAERG
ncbi:hypothetical protein [Rhodothermus marinus]|uniref:hypothetical protein n=1 Tax=Rhodothermus marinus TaxID=29549 RepID=UPI000AFF3F96|nr:hypothetical protein [Rhodothermus marinus]